MFAPVRPTAKHLEPSTAIGAYVQRHDAEGLPLDPWLRVHIRAGSKIVKVAPTGMARSHPRRRVVGIRRADVGDAIIGDGVPLLRRRWLRGRSYRG